ncbi:MAG TPA: glycoside hydrolase family 2 TIM barrel-domain containing protein [Candidatus Sulfopaludibacter sp.]|nr:glycoside hydrolase family 2 TIM barrel-domain containing protein [Candidatus Sulfopaludibacter sp.]
MNHNLKSGRFFGSAVLFYRSMLLSGWLGFGLLMTASAQPYNPPANNRVDVNLDPGWRFIEQNVAGAQATNFDDSSWTGVNLPHTWDIPDGQSYPPANYYTGISWYRTHFTPDGSYTNRHFFLKFDGAFRVADVYLNGNYLGEHDGGFAAFVFDVTPYLNVGGDNVLAVEVNNAINTNIPPLAADFTFWGGIYRDVHLLVTDPVQISPLDYGSSGVYLTTTSVSSNSANLLVTTVVSNSTASAQTVMVRAVVTDAATNIVTILSNVVTLPAASVSNVTTSTVIANPHLWNGLSDPYLYQTFVELWNGTNAADVVAQPLGFRYFSVDPTNGFFLNGQHYDLHGVNMHQDWLNCGWALTNAQRDTNFLFIKEIGATFVRLSHYEHNDYTYQLADQNGVCLWSEIPLIDYITTSAAFTSNTLQQLREMVRQRYNHPSIIFWSVYNEVTLSMGDQGSGTLSTTNLISQEVQQVSQDDPTRLSTAGANTSDNDPSTLYTQVIAFNKYYGWYSTPLNGIGAWADNFHATYPNRCVGVSEYGAGASIYQHSENPTFPANTGSNFHPEEWQNIVIETNWQSMAARPFLWCKLVWTSFDFASDGRDEGDTPGRNDKGVITYDRGVRKDAFYYFKANWTTNPMVYITGHTFTNRLTNSITAKVYANCDTVELFLNGVSQGATASSNCIYTWPLVLQSGTNTVQAVGTKGGSNVTDSLIWFAPSAPPAPPTAAITNPPFPTVYLYSTNVTLQLAATARDNQPGSPPPMTTDWIQTSGPGTVTFGNTNALSTTATFSANGVYGLTFQAIKGALATSVPLTVVVGNVPYGPTLTLRYPFDDAGPGTTTPSDTSLGSELNVPLQMINANGASADLHGAAGSGVAGLTNPNRALNLSLNPNQGQTGGASGSFAAVTNSALGLGNVTNFVVTWWMKQLYYLPANYGPRMFILGSSLNDADSGTANSISMKWQDASDWYFYVNTVQATASFGSRPPTNSWMFVAMAYDGTNVTLYEGSDQNSASLVSTTAAAGQAVTLDSTAALFLGNRPARNRCFAGWIDDFRVYTGWGDASFVEGVRQSSAGPAGLIAVPGNSQVTLTWNALLGATSYNVKRSTVSGGPYTTISTPGTVTGTSYVDNTAVGGTTYYYTVSAATSLSEASETANSATEASATPTCTTPPAPTAGYNSPIYAGMTLNLTASTVPGATYSWTGPGGFVSTDQNPSITNVTAAAAGIYNVSAIVGGCASVPAAITVTVNPPATLSVEALNGSLILGWPYGTLQSATNLTGPWDDLMGVMSPYTNVPGEPQEFFRVRLQ